MRMPLLFTVVAPLLGCAHQATAPALTKPATAASAAAGRVGDVTRVDRPDIAFELPGAWTQQPSSEGARWQRGEQEQVLYTVLPQMEGLDGVSSAEKLAEVNGSVIAQSCTRGVRVGPLARVDRPGLISYRLTLSCEEPRFVLTLVAAAAAGRVVSFEHFHVGVSALTPEAERAATAISDSLRVKPGAGADCPPAVLAQMDQQPGLCFEPTMLGDAVTTACVHEIEQRLWLRDIPTATAIGQQTKKQLVCYRRP